jgi:hypothetical protein
MIFPEECNVSKTPIDAYREGYEKGKSNNLVGHTAEAVFGLLFDHTDSPNHGSAVNIRHPLAAVAIYAIGLTSREIMRVGTYVPKRCAVL